jgi:hypothetical protein
VMMMMIMITIKTSDWRGFAYLRLELQEIEIHGTVPSSLVSTGPKMSLARPFDDFCRRDHVFLVVVVFEFEFVVCRSGILNQVSHGSDAFHDRSTITNTYSTMGRDVLRGSDDFRTVETAGVWVQGHDCRTRRKLLVGAYVCWGSGRRILVG